jgi:para-aminobenzoate synthetase component 1
MIVDLARNDLSIVSEAGSVTVDALLSVEQHPGLVHLVSRISGQLPAGCLWADILAATLPPASVTGTPKSTALQAIADLEPVPRGPYCGAIGWVDADAGTAELAVGIRTFWVARDDAGRRVLRFGTGAGITWGSDPAQEWEETELKARRLVGLASGRVLA